MAKFISNKELQKQLEEKKWLDGIKLGKDPCGTYDYCKFCDKTKETPCAKAFNLSWRHNQCVKASKMRIR